MNTPILSDIKVLDNLLALNLNVSLWVGPQEDGAGRLRRRGTAP